MTQGYEVPEGEQTRLDNDLLWEIDSMDELQESKELIPPYFDLGQNFASFSIFISNTAKKRGFSGKENDTAALAAFIHNAVIKTGGNLSKATIKNWLTKSGPDGNGRTNVYQLCFALELDVPQTFELFMKAYFERPFDFHRIEECIYWYCIKNHLPYCHALEMIQSVQNSSHEDDAPVIDATNQIAEQVKQFDDEALLIHFLSTHQSSFEVNNKTGREKTEKLIDECKELANQLQAEKKAIINSADDLDTAHKLIDSDEKLLAEIYGFHARSEEYKGYGFAFPDRVKRNFPQFSQLQKIRSGNGLTYDIVRKALILFGFYRFFATIRLESDGDIEGDVFDEFKDEMNGILDECGYASLYVRTPYDWMFLHCATTASPLEELQTFTNDFWQEK